MRPARTGVALLVYDLDAVGGAERTAAALARELGKREPVLVVTTNASRGKVGVTRSGNLRVVRAPAWVPAAWWSYALTQTLFELVAALAIRRYGSGRAILGIPAYPCGLEAARLARALGRASVGQAACSGESGDFAALARSGESLAELDRLVVLNDESRAEALAAGVLGERLRAIPNPVDLGRFPDDLAPAALDLSPGSELVLFVGRLERQKRVPVLLEAFERLLQERPRAVLALAGKGSLRAELETRAASLGGRVRFLGARTDVPALLRAASVFVLPSGEEGQSLALLEALAAGTPVVATDTAGTRATVTAGREALVVPVDDAGELARAIERLLDDRSLAASLARAGRERVRDFTIERVARAYEELFRELPRPSRVEARAFWTFVLGRVSRILGVGLGHARERLASHADLWGRRAITAVVLGGKRLFGRRPRVDGPSGVRYGAPPRRARGTGVR